MRCSLFFVALSILLILSFHFLNEGAQSSNLIIFVLLKVEVVLLAKPQLQKVVIEGLLGNVHFGGGIFKRIAHKVAVTKDSIIEPTPQAHFLDDFLDRALFRPLAFILIAVLKSCQIMRD